MNSVYRVLIGGLFWAVLGVGCRLSDKNSSTSSSSEIYSCAYKKSGELMLCNQYQGLSGTTLTAIQSDCELRGAEGYSWSVAGCPDKSVGRCSLPATPKIAAVGTQYYYGPAFSSLDTAARMCTAQNGAFN